MPTSLHRWFAVAAVLAALAPWAGADPVSFRLPRTIQETLDNGLRVIVCPLAGRGLVDVRVEVRVGAWLEGEHQGSGISHYFEHLLAGGSTTTRKAAETDALLRRMGGVMSATTDADRTWVHLVVTPEHVGQALDLLADQVRHCAVDAAEFERERGVILNELAMYRDQPLRRAWERMHEAAFTRHPARYPMQGHREAFERVTREQVQAFYRAHYVPRNAVVSITGDVDPGTAMRRARAAFADWRGGDPPEIEPFHEPAQTAPRRLVETGPGSLSALVIGWKTVDLRHEDVPALDLLKHIAGGGREGRLVRRVVEQDRLVERVQVLSRNPAFGGGLFVVMGTVDPARVADLERAVDDELAALAREGPTAEELEGSRRRALAEITFGLESVEALGHKLATDAVLLGDSHFLDGYVRRMQAVTTADVQRVAARYLVAERRTACEVRPAPAGATAPADVLAQAAAVREEILANGLRLLIETRPGSGAAALHLAIRAGVCAESEDTVGASAVLGGLLVRAQDTEARAMQARLAARGGSVQAVNDPTSLGLEVRVLADDLPLAVEWLGVALGRFGCDAAAVQAEADRARSRLMERRAAFESDADDRLREVVYAGRPLAWPWLGTEKSLAALDAERMRAFAAATLCGPNLALAIVGDVDAARVRDAVVEAFAALPAGEARPLPADAAPDLAGGPVRFATDREQATLVVAFAGAGVEAHAERIALDLLDAFASGRRLPGGPLFDALRVNQDLAYYVDASHRPMPGGGLFQVVVQCDPARLDAVDTAVQAVFDELARGECLDAAALDTARSVLLLSRASAEQTSAARARMLALGAIWGLPVDATERYRTEVEDMDVERLRAAAQRTFAQPGKRVILWPKGVKQP